MSQWKTVPIKEVYVGLFDGPHATPKVSESGPIFLGIKNVGENGQVDFSDIRHISEEEYPRWTKRIEPKYGDIVFSYEATLNRYAIIPKGFRGCLGRRMALIRPDESKICGRFLFHYFFGKEWRNVIAQNTLIGSTVDRIPIAKFPNFPITIPPIPVQQKIASILSAYDDLIENNTRRITILEEMAQTIYNEWFVKFRFPGHENVKMVASEFGMIPERWEVKPFSEMVYLNPTEKVLKDVEKPYVPMECLRTNSMLITSKEVRKTISGSKFRNGDTLFARITPCLENGKTAFVQFLPDNNPVGIGSTEFIVFRSKTLCPEYVYLLSRTDNFRENAIKSMAGASGRQRVNIQCFDNYMLPQANNEILLMFSKLMKPLFREIYLLSEKNSVLQSTRDLLLPRLISGEVDVSELDIDVGGITA